MKRIFFSAHNTSEAETLPRFAVVEHDNIPTLLDELANLQRICADHGLTEVRRYFDVYFEGEDDLGVDCYELVVCKSGFWFEAQSKHYDSRVETWFESISDFLKKIDACSSDEDLFIGEQDEEYGERWSVLVDEYDEEHRA